MILYDKTLALELPRFGIQIPIRDNKAEKGFRALLEQKVLAGTKEKWHIDTITEKLSKADLLRAHAPEYVERLFSDGVENEIIKTFELIDDKGKYHRYNPEDADLALSLLFDRILKKAAGTAQCCRAALESGFCFYFGGGMHHAQYHHGKGFCMVNDIVIAIRKLQAEGLIRTAWVIDTDAHKGDGTAALTADDPSIITLSIHMGAGWPLDEARKDEAGKPNPSFIRSDIDIPVMPGEDHLYNEKLEKGLAGLETRPNPDIAVVVMGADAYEHDELPSTDGLNLTLEEMGERDRQVYDFLGRREIPGAFLMAGGYGERAWEVHPHFLIPVLTRRYGKGSESF